MSCHHLSVNTLILINAQNHNTLSSPTHFTISTSDWQQQSSDQRPNQQHQSTWLQSAHYAHPVSEAPLEQEGRSAVCEIRAGLMSKIGQVRRKGRSDTMPLDIGMATQPSATHAHTHTSMTLCSHDDLLIARAVGKQGCWLPGATATLVKLTKRDMGRKRARGWWRKRE